jgi:hypothetical protein
MDSKAFAILVRVENLSLFTLTHKDLGLPQTFASASSLYQEEHAQVWRSGIDKTFKGCCYYALEVGRGDYKDPKRGLLHAHVIAAFNDALEVRRLQENCKPVYDLQGVIRYLQKPPEPYSLEAVNEYVSYRILANGKAPRSKGFLVSKRRQDWNAKNHDPLT